MAISRVRTWSAGEVLTAADLNAEFNNILNNPVDLWSPAAKAADMNGFELILDADGDTSITADTDDRIDFRVGGTDRVSLTASALDIGALEFILDADGDTSITADTDDRIDVRVNGVDEFVLDMSQVVFMSKVF